MRESVKNKIPLRNFCFKPVVEVDGGISCNNCKKADDRFVPKNVEDDNLPSRPPNRSLSRVLKGALFESALTRRIQRRKSRANGKSGPAPTSGQPLTGPVAGRGFKHGDANEFATKDSPPVQSSSNLASSESKISYITVDGILSGYGTETSGTVSRHEADVEETVGVDERLPLPRRLVKAAFSLLGHRGIQVLLFTSVALCAIFLRRTAGSWLAYHCVR
ncbi:hypothetical protein SAY87_011649 [Trapa incisa]|uniref:Uncharacterized protein n=1 Tax=Trapa incisa TaxID=236973 RepID=A0AAN7GS88_9MYRT|nr:hypothetical protein SAY87_011649 [Trapa incisa]